MGAESDIRPYCQRQLAFLRLAELTKFAGVGAAVEVGPMATVAPIDIGQRAWIGAACE